MKCPKCKQTDLFSYESRDIVTTMTTVCKDTYPKSEIPYYEIENVISGRVVLTWIEDESMCWCNKCRYQGKVEDFDDGVMPDSYLRKSSMSVTDLVH